MNRRLHPAASAFAATMALLAQAPRAVGASSSPCTGDDLVGQCVGTHAVWCENSTRYEVDCDALGLTCGWDETNEWWSCIEANPGGGCPGGITWEGLCASEVLLIWCEDAQVRSMLCPSGTTCAWDDEQGFFDCVATDALVAAPASSVDAEEGGAPGDRGSVDDGAPPDTGDAERPESPLPERSSGDWTAGAEPRESTTSPVPTAPVGSRPPSAAHLADTTTTSNSSGDAGAATAKPHATTGGCAAAPVTPEGPVVLLLPVLALGMARRRGAAPHRPPAS